MFIICNNIGLSIFNILSVLITKINQKEVFYGHSISVRYASPAHVKNESNKIVEFIFDKRLY